MVLFGLFTILYGFQKQKKQLKPLEHEVIVELVVVEVFVTDKKGNFVDNLTRDDFEIYEDGKKVDIQYFAVKTPEWDILRKKEPEKILEQRIPTRPKERRLVILFDNINTNRIFLNRYWPKFAEMFKSLSGKVDETMIMELNREYGTRIIQPFTSDQSLLVDKFSEFRGDMWLEFEKEILRNLIKELEKEARLSIEDRFIVNPEYIMGALMQEESYIRRRRLEDTFSTFLAAVNYIRRYGGIKSVLIVSDGFRINRHQIVRIFDPFKIFGKKKYFNQLEAFERFLKLINEENLIFYAFSPKGLRSYFDVYPSSYSTGTGELFKDEMTRWAQELYSLQEIAEESGGVYLRGAKKYENFVKELGRDLTHFYDISYTPPGREKKGGYHRIEVRVKKPGLIVRYKKGYADFTEEELERKATATAFLTPSYFKDITFSCKTDFISLRGGGPQFWVRMQIPLDQFRNAQDMSSQEKLALMFGIKEKTKDKVHFGVKELEVSNGIERGVQSLYRAFITSVIKLKPGEYDTRVILKNPEGQIGGWEAPINVPELKKELPLSVVSAIFGFLSEEEENKIPFSISINDGSLLLSQYRLYPLVEDVIKKSENVALFLQIYNPKEIKEFPLQFSLFKDGNFILDLPYQKIESYFDKEPKILNDVYLLDFQDVTPGDYQLKVKLPESQVERKIEIKVIS